MNNTFVNELRLDSSQDTKRYPKGSIKVEDTGSTSGKFGFI